LRTLSHFLKADDVELQSKSAEIFSHLTSLEISRYSISFSFLLSSLFSLHYLSSFFFSFFSLINLNNYWFYRIISFLFSCQRVVGVHCPNIGGCVEASCGWHCVFACDPRTSTPFTLSFLSVGISFVLLYFKDFTYLVFFLILKFCCSDIVLFEFSFQRHTLEQWWFECHFVDYSSHKNERVSDCHRLHSFLIVLSLWLLSSNTFPFIFFSMSRKGKKLICIFSLWIGIEISWYTPHYSLFSHHCRWRCQYSFFSLFFRSLKSHVISYSWDRHFFF